MPAPDSAAIELAIPLGMAGVQAAMLAIQVRAVAREKPPKLYHYTRRQGAAGILASSMFFATHWRFLNDPQECHALHGAASDAVTRRVGTRRLPATLMSTATIAEIERFLWMALGGFSDVPQLLEPYVASLTTLPDSPVHWADYADEGRGFALVLDTMKVLDGLLRDRPRRPGLVGPVLYRPDEHDAIVDAGIKAIAAALQPLLGTGEIRDGDALGDLVGRALHLFVICIAPIAKDPALQHEREWRFLGWRMSDGAVVATPPDQQHVHPDLFHRIVADQRIPYLKLLFSLDAVTGVVAGPNAAEEDIMAIVADCAAAGLASVEVTRSTLSPEAITSAHLRQ